MTNNHTSASTAYSRRVMVVGATGQLGREFQHLASAWPHTFKFLTRHDADLTCLEDVERQMDEFQAEVVINCAAYTQVDRAEQDREKAYAANVTGVRNLALACHARGAALIHFSSDYVYHNALNRPLLETDPVEPKGYYAQTKLWGEEVALQQCPETMVIRTSWVYSTWGHNFVKTMLRLGHEKPMVQVVDDQIGTPTWTRDLATAVLHIITYFDPILWKGIYNYSDSGVASWFDFACSILRLNGCPTSVMPIPTVQYPTPAVRPPYSVLSKQKIKSTFNLNIPHWEDSLRSCLEELATLSLDIQ